MKTLKIALSLFALFLSAEAFSQNGFNLVKNIYPHGGDCKAQYFTEYNGKVYFSADDSLHSIELWVTDGTTAGTHIVSDINQGRDKNGYPAGSGPRNLTVYNGKLYFSATDDGKTLELWATNGTDTGTKLVKSTQIYPPNVYKSKMFFESLDTTYGYELWVSDGTDIGTHIFKDINPGKGNAGVSNLTLFNNRVYFAANDGKHGYELWATDGTDTGTNMVKDINPYGDSYPGINLNDYGRLIKFRVSGNKMYFIADDSIHGLELWVTDGTSKGTILTKDINPSGWSNPGEMGGLFSYKDSLFFDADQDGSGNQYLWTSDGTKARTSLFGYFKDPLAYCIYNNSLVIDCTNPNGKFGLQISDGTKSGTSSIKDTKTGITIGGGYFNIINNKLYFYGPHDQLWVTDGSDTGTHGLVLNGATNLTPMNDVYYPIKEIFKYDSILIYRANYTNGFALWSFNPAQHVYTSIENKKRTDESISSKGFKTYPNPTKGNTIYIHPDEAFIGKAQVQILSLEGKVQYQKLIKNFCSDASITFPDNIPAGMYLITITTQDNVYTNKIIINH